MAAASKQKTGSAKPNLRKNNRRRKKKRSVWDEADEMSEGTDDNDYYWEELRCDVCGMEGESEGHAGCRVELSGEDCNQDMVQLMKF